MQTSEPIRAATPPGTLGTAGAPARDGARAAARRGGFTLIELLVVVAVLAILISILLPALGTARGAAWKIVGASNQKQLFTGVFSYSAESKGWFPGINTSGWNLALLSQGNPAQRLPLAQVQAWARRSGSSPVQSFDWMSPGMDPDALPMERAARFYLLLERFADPAMRERSPVYFGGGESGAADNGAQEMATYINENRKPPARGVSYLMPIFFQCLGGNTRGPGPGATARTLGYGQPTATRDQASMPSSFKPRHDAIDQPARKIAIADGFRYWDATGLDFDASYSPSIYGSFTSGGAVFSNETSYGGTGNPSRGQQLALTYRHAGRLNTMYWDGHGESITREQSFNPTLWYPTGSIFNGTGNTVPEAFKFYEAGQRIN